jgi:hydroxypyruvate isomerase
MKLSVCIDALFWDKDFEESMRAVKAAEVDTIEFWAWWNKDLEAVVKAKEELNLSVSALCTKFASLTDSTKRDEYISGLRESIKIAKMLGCKSLITQVGNELSDVSREEQHRSIVQGLQACTSLLEEADITLLVEPLNIVVDHKGYYLYSSDEAFKIIEEVGSSKVKVLFDIYHQQITEGNLIQRITRNIDKIGHFHAAGNPGRHELSLGEINYGEIIKAIDKAGYSGYFGLEYFPEKDVIEGIKEVVKMME